MFVRTFLIVGVAVLAWSVLARSSDAHGGRQVLTVRPGDTVQSLASRMAYRDFKLERFLSLNGLASNAVLAPGRKVKLVVYGTRRA